MSERKTCARHARVFFHIQQSFILENSAFIFSLSAEESKKLRAKGLKIP
jgi:hypothetical protein